MKRFYSISLVAHACLLVLAINLSGGKGEGDKEGNGKGAGGGDKVNFIPKVINVEVFVERGEGLTPKEAKTGKTTARKCLDNLWYGGIGIQSGFTGKIEAVAPGYAADRAGIKVGDFVQGNVEIRGKPGTEVTLTIFRPSTNETFTLTLTREKICYEE